ncbi:ras-associating and dilute domain-containing protein-like [Syngnathoides biaculeatus]|uniref:ras-associating and dilute domain-containing protein-like n=1 Tax=Syngnathoides biaculeatus TaxID=300417 RepID=UPI002ADE2332|nr:ras-associating and dilute domain-containing protein-like [Syngnathoides biaculeatus]
MKKNKKMISDERSLHVGNKQSAVVGLLIRSPKKRLAQLGRKASNGSTQSNSSTGLVRLAESSGVRQPAKSKIRRHNNNNNNKRLSGVFNHSPNLRRGGPSTEDDPAELSCQLSVPGILKIFGSDICQGANYKSVLATTQSSAKELLKEALDRYSLAKEDASAYVLCDVIGQTSPGSQWRRECFRVVGDHEKPLVLQSLWKPKEGFSRRFEIQLRVCLEEQSLKERDTVTAGINAQARKLQRNRSRATSLFMENSTTEDADGPDFWRSLSEMDLSAMSKEVRGAPRVRDQDEDKDALRLGVQEKEETESSDDNATQYSIHPPFDFPYFLLLQGYNHRQDFVIYLLSGSSTVLGCCGEHRAGEDEERLKVDILLFAPDVLPRHCSVRRLDSATVIKPLHDAPVTKNGSVLKEEAQLHPGDLVGLGEHYLFMFKDPTGAATGPPQTKTPPWMSRLFPASEMPPICQSCSWHPAVGKDNVAEDDQAMLSYDLEREDQVLQEIMDMSESDGARPKLTVAFLLSLCIQYSAALQDLHHFRRLLLKIAGTVQKAVWDKTKALASMQTDSVVEGSLPLQTQDIISGLRPLAAWMANTIELLHFIQQRVPQLMAARQDSQKTGLMDKQELASTRESCEEAMTVLEEVIMFTFQQSVYYLTKSMYSALPAVLDGNPFSESGHLRVPDGVSGILEVLKEALQLFTSFQVHADICLQLCAYLFFFINASLFNALIERGSEAGFYQWSRGVQMRANLDLMMDWLQSISLADVAADFFQKLSAAVNLLATPKETLQQASWTSLKFEFSALNAAQLQHMLSQYNTGKTRPGGWTPGPEHADDACRTEDILERFDKHPPLILPSRSFFLEEAHQDPTLLEQLVHLQQAIRQTSQKESLSPQEEMVSEERTSTSSTRVLSEAPSTPYSQGPVPDLGSEPSIGEEDLSRKMESVEGHSFLSGGSQRDVCDDSLPLDPSCLLTPPNTPQEVQVHHNNNDRGHVVEKEDKEDKCDDVFTVEIHRGPHGLGLALVDGTKTSLRMSGIYVKSLVPDSPAARCRRLKTGDRILAVNGVSLLGLDYSVGREVIRSSGDSLRLLVANMDPNMSSQTTKC